MKFNINTLQDLKTLQEKLINGENIIIGEVSNITHTIKLNGGRFNNYDISYINADIAKIILSYQESYTKTACILEKDYGISTIDKNLLIRFKLEKGCLKIEINDFLKSILEAVKNMESLHKTILGVTIAIVAGGYFSYSKYLEHDENIIKLQKEENTRELLASLKADKELQNAINEPKLTTLRSLQDDESATFNDESEAITKADINKYEFKDIIDTTATSDITDEFNIYGFEITNDKKRKFKLKVDDKLRWVWADMISAGDRMILADAIEKSAAIKLKLRVIKEYDKVKEIQIIDIIKD